MTDVTLQSGPSFILPYALNFVYITTEEEALKALGELATHKILSIDIETTGLDPFSENILLLQIATPVKCYILNCVLVNPIVWAPILSDDSILKILQNVKFDYKFIKKHIGISIRNLYCTMLAELCLTAGIRAFVNLAALSLKYLGISLNKETRKGFVGTIRSEFTEQELIYAANDALILHSIYNSQIVLLEKEGLLGVARLEFRTVVPTAEMELNGLRLDEEKWNSLIELAEERVIKFEKEVQQYLLPVCDQLTILGECTINISSHKQLLKHLNKLGLELESTEDKVLKALKHPIGEPLKQWRKWHTVVTRYGEKFLSRINPNTGRLHANFFQYGTNTGRFSAAKPNPQQVPRFDPDDPMSLDFRSCFIASPKHNMVVNDYGQEELRILAELSGDKNMIRAYEVGDDIHTTAAAGIFNVPLDKVSKRQRTDSKTFNFSITYGASSYKISSMLKCSEEKAQKYIDGYFFKFPGVKNYLIKSHNFVMCNGYVSTVLGRKRYFSLPTPEDLEYKKKIGSIKRESGNAPIQGAAADILKEAMCNVFYNAEKENLNIKLLLVVHDEIVCECPEEDSEKAAKFLEKSMLDAFHKFFKIPMVVDACVSKSWYK